MSKQPANILTIDELKKLVDNFKQQPKTPCGVVFRSALKEAILKHFPQADTQGCLYLPFFVLPVYFDHKQEQDCLVFENRDLLNAYLNRDTDPEAWARKLIKHLPNQLSIDDISRMSPRIPLPPPLSNIEYISPFRCYWQ